jgi:uncharacterized OB-fold protein
MADQEVLSAQHVLEYPYKRSVGPVIGAFLGALKEQRLQGVKTPDGRVIFPPTEYDPDTSEPTGDAVDVGPGGVVTAWCWVGEPRPRQPLDRPFAWALVKLDGADTAMLHAVDAGEASKMATGMRVRPRWAETPKGIVTDLACFEPEGAA